MWKNWKIKKKLTTAFIGVSLGTLLLAYLGMFALMRSLRVSLEALYTEIAENAEEGTEDALLSQADSAIDAIVSVQTEATNSRLMSLSSIVEESSIFLEELYRGESRIRNGSFEALPWEESPMEGLYARYLLSEKGEPDQKAIQEELSLLKNAEVMFSPIMKYNLILDEIYIGTESGIFYDYDRMNDSLEGFEARERPWYKNACANPGKVIWEETYIDVNGQACITAAKSFRGADGEIAGVIGIDVRFNQVMEQILADGLGDTGISFLLGKSLDLIVYKDSFDDDFDPSPEAHFGDPALLRAGLEDPSAKAFLLTLDEEDFYMKGAKLPETGWTFCTGIAKAEILNPIDRVRGETQGILEDAGERMLKSLRRVLLNILLSFFVIAAVVSAIAASLARSLTAPLARLKEKSSLIGKGDFETKIEPESQDEIGELALKFGQMQDSLKCYTEHLAEVSAEKERISTELNIATNIQASMLPRIFPPFPEIPEIDIFASMDPAKEVGGDFYDFFMLGEDHLAMVVADVSGKGVPAALFMVIGKTLIKDRTNPDQDLGSVFSEVNDILCESNSEELFITAFEAILNIRTGEVRYVNAGHEHPFLMERNEEGSYSYTELRPKAGMVLAGMEGMRYRPGSFFMKPGDRLFQYTDGVPEATDGNNQLYGMERLERFLNSHTDLSPEKLLPALRADIDAFTGDAPQFDDITMLCLEFRKLM